MSSPFETKSFTLKYEVELPFKVSDRLFYVFSDRPIGNGRNVTAINLGHDVFSVPKLHRLSMKGELLLEINPNGFIRPRFEFYGKGDSSSKSGHIVECPEFYFENFQIRGPTFSWF